MISRDIKIRESDMDLEIRDGDFVIDDSDGRHIEHILIAHKGEWRQAPLLGIGLSSYLGGPNDTITRNSLEQKTRLNLEFDGYKVKFIDMRTLDDIQIDAEFKG